MAKKNSQANPGTMKKVLRYIGRYKLLLPISLLMALITVALTLYLPILIGEAIDIIGEPEINMSKIFDIFVKASLIIGATALAQWIMSTINNKISYHVVKDIRNDAFSKIETLPLSYLDKRSRGDIVSRVINDSERFSEGLILGFTQLFTGVLTIVGTLAFMLSINVMVTIVVVVLTPLSLFIARFIATHTYSLFKKRSEDEGKTTALIEEIIGNQKIVKAFSHEDESIRDFNVLNEKLQKSTLKAIFYSSITNPATRFVNNIVYAAVALFGALIAIKQSETLGVAAVSFTIGELSCLLSYANQYTKPFNEISGVVTEFQGALACASRVFELTEEASEIPDCDDAIAIDKAEGDIAFKDVCFSYDKNVPIIENMSLNVKSGQRIAIVGPTGCGKTTLINLLMRFYDVDSGSITLDEHDTRKITRSSLRSNCAMVLQDTWLKNDTVKNNIKMGNPNATDEEVIRAAKEAHAHSFIKRLKNGYDTVIGEGGELLSQGQRQLLCIARVMLSLPPVLILDEATSSIDTRTEMRIQKAFGHMMQGRTSFIVAHRLSTIVEADLILVMKDGRIIETGNHSQLIEKKGFYYNLFNSQFAH